MDVGSLRARALGLAVCLLAMLCTTATGDATAATIKQTELKTESGETVGVGIDYRAAPGERNKLTTSCKLLAAGSVPLYNWSSCTLTEAGASIVDGDGAGGCSVSGRTGTCYVFHSVVNADLGDGNDSAAGPFEASSPNTTVADGPGNDTIWLGSKLTTVEMDPGGSDVAAAQRVSYGSGYRTSGVTVTLDGKANDGNAADGPDGHRDNVIARWITGTDYNDVLIGDAADNDLRGLKGNDQLIGCAGDDSLNGYEGNDKLLDDRIGTCTGGGRDRLWGGGGADVFDSGSDQDFVEADANDLAPNDRDKRISCGTGDDYLWVDAIDPAGRSCEHTKTR